LIPFPAATDNHQFHNARAMVETGAARMLGEQRSTPENFTPMVVELMTNIIERRRLASALAGWHHPNAARHPELDSPRASGSNGGTGRRAGRH
jgi:UDP-N-acetylglucosamine--N-acetylmuramyl-(pentapeptide) pyrophosphoryl-undecaprenol N-acetylglucosamine transferase